MRRLVAPFLILIASALSAVELAPPPLDRWYLDAPGDGAEGADVRPLAERTWTPPEAPVIVAVIDSGIDTTHPELAPVVWTNEAEQSGEAGRDDDGNGFVDDLHGWNFLGGPKGERNLVDARLEETRELARLRQLAEDRELTAEEEAYRDELQASFDERWRGAARQCQEAFGLVAALDAIEADLRAQGFDPDRVDVDAVRAKDPYLAQLFRSYGRHWQRRHGLRAWYGGLRHEFRTHFCYAFDDRSVMGDDPAKLDDRAYGNPRVDLPGDNDHGTMVAGTIARVVAGAVGGKDLPKYLRIISLRAVPNGDEHDKDVANAIRYAVDQGARVINLSFGKRFSPGKAAVDAAIAHARDRGVLLVSGCGNDGADTDRETYHPNPVPLGGGERCPTWLSVGASGRGGDRLAADFSNYGERTVDLFAPGVDIAAPADGGGEANADGTSLAAPVVSGVAVLALIRHPELDGAALAEALRASARPYPDRETRLPGTGRRGPKVAFAKLSMSGGIVDAVRLLEHLDPKEEAPVAEPEEKKADEAP